MRTLRSYFRLNPFERWIVVQSVAGLVIARIGLRVAGFGVWKKVVTWLSSANAESREVEDTRSFASSIARTQAAAERHLFFRPSCLEHALVLWYLLRRHGVAALIRIGGRKEQGVFEAHAWVEVDGLPIGDADGAHRGFVPFAGPVAVMENQIR